MSSSGRVRMPHNNRVSSSSALATNDIWSKTIGYNPYAASTEQTEDSSAAQEQAAGLMLLAKMSNLSGSESRGGCKKCGMLGHLTFQCRNTIQLSTSKSDSDDSSSSDSGGDDVEPIRGRRPAEVGKFNTGRSPPRDRSRSRDRDTSLDRKYGKEDAHERNSDHRQSFERNRERDWGRDRENEVRRRRDEDEDSSPKREKKSKGPKKSKKGGKDSKKKDKKEKKGKKEKKEKRASEK